MIELTNYIINHFLQRLLDVAIPTFRSCTSHTAVQSPRVTVKTLFECHTLLSRINSPINLATTILIVTNVHLSFPPLIASIWTVLTLGLQEPLLSILSVITL